MSAGLSIQVAQMYYLRQKFSHDRSLDWSTGERTVEMEDFLPHVDLILP